MGESALVSYMKGKTHCEWAPSVSGSQRSYFSKSKSTDFSPPSGGSNNYLSAHSTSSIRKSSLDSIL